MATREEKFTEFLSGVKFHRGGGLTDFELYEQAAESWNEMKAEMESENPYYTVQKGFRVTPDLDTESLHMICVDYLMSCFADHENIEEWVRDTMITWEAEYIRVQTRRLEIIAEAYPYLKAACEE